VQPTTTNKNKNKSLDSINRKTSLLLTAWKAVTNNTPSLAPSRMLPPNHLPALNDNQQEEETPRPYQPEDLISLAA
jgi:hypothetical protein